MGWLGPTCGSCGGTGYGGEIWCHRCGARHMEPANGSYGLAVMAGVLPTLVVTLPLELLTDNSWVIWVVQLSVWILSALLFHRLWPDCPTRAKDEADEG